MQHYLRKFGSVLIFLGFSVLALGVIGSIAFWIFTLFTQKEYAWAIVSSGTICIVTGYALRKIIREPPKKL